MKSNYRADIDGLRAVAVISVLLYHLGVEGFSGGFVGVDVFFVISGFLITGLIRHEVLETGRFRFTAFYVRRMRRLLPALFTTLLGTTLASVLLLSPQYLKAFGESLLASVVSVSNFYFWQEAGYFDSSSQLKPLLHTWSLSVEEQFYLLWPAALVLLLRKAAPAVVLSGVVAAGVISFGLNILTLRLDAVGSSQAAVFFLLPFRAFEFAIGGLLIWCAPHQPKTNLARESILLLGLGLIGYAVTTFTEETAFPSYNALIPCVGAALAIYGGRARTLGKLLANPVSVGLGRISYSLYLVHWPIAVLWGYAVFGQLELTDRVAVAGLSLASATVMYHYVETPYRTQWRPATPFRRFAVAMATVLLVTGTSIAAQNGWQWRLSNDQRAFGIDFDDYHKNYYGGVGIPANSVVSLGSKEASEPVFMLAGDSLSSQYANAVNDLLSQHALAATGLFDHGCLLTPDSTRYIKGREDEQCSAEYGKLVRVLAEHPTADLFLAHSWGGYRGRLGPRGGNKPFAFPSASEYRDYVIDQTEKLILQNGNKRQYFLIGTPERYAGQGETLLDCLSRPLSTPESCRHYSPRTKPEINRVLQRLAGKHLNVHYVEPREALCSESRCRNVVDGKPVHSDGGHLSLSGAWVVVNQFKELFLRKQHTSELASTSAQPEN